jgi:uncharacterized membrane protein
MDETASILAENKKLHSSIKDLKARLTQTRHREDLEVKVLALEKEHQQKGKTFSIVMWVFGVVICLSIFSCAELETEHDFSREAIAQLQKEKER